jgi:hypothetical protein
MLFTVKLASLNSTVQGYLAKGEGKFPALVLYQWAGAHALNTKTSTGRGAIVFRAPSAASPC